VIALPSTVPDRPVTARSVILFALTGAMTAAAWHLGVIALRSRGLGMLTWTGDDLGWMAPLAYLALFAVLALPLALLVRVAPGRSVAAVALGAIAFLALGSMALLVPRIAPYALLMLALGVAAEVTRRLLRAPAAWRWVRRLAVVSTVVCVAFAAESVIRQSVRHAGVERGNAAAGAPNVLLIILDTVRAANLSVYGYARPTTPSLVRLAASGTAFDRAIAPAPWTLPSHASMFTGRRASELGTEWKRPWVARDSTLAELLLRRGYDTGGFVANLVYTPHEVGLSRGFETYEDFVRSPRQFLGSTVLGQLPWVNVLLFDDSTAKRQSEALGSSWRLPRVALTARKTAGRVTDEFLRWEDGVDGRPFFAFLNYFDAHVPFEPPPAYATRFGNGAAPVDRYDGAIASIDEQLGRLFAELERRGVLDRTLVIVTADHGEQFGEHGLVEHGNSLYTQVLNVPLIMRWPGHVPEGRRVRTPVSMRDLGATVLALLGTPGAVDFPGQSFASLFSTDGGAPARALYADVGKNPSQSPDGPNQFGDMEAIFSDRYQYIRNYGTGREELYDFEADFDDVHDLSAAATASDVMARMRALSTVRVARR
jgi:arylsulfatase A-like enzyme